MKDNSAVSLQHPEASGRGKTKKLSIAIFFFASLALLISFGDICFASVAQDAEEDSIILSEPQYVPGEVIVKFREGADPQAMLQAASIETSDIQRVHSIKPAVSKFKKDYKLEKADDGWYSFLGKNYKEAADIPDEEMFKEAYSNMPEAEKSIYRVYKIGIPEDVSVEETVNKLKQDPSVEYAEPNYIVRVQMAPNDLYYNTRPDENGKYSWGQFYPDLWGIRKIQCEEAWDISQGEGIVVAVIDTGVDYTHPDLAENIWTNIDETPNNGIDDDGNGYMDDVHGYDFAYNDPDPMDVYGHGTHVAGTIAAAGNNTIGVIGVAPKAKVMIVRGLDDKGSGTIESLAGCVIYAADNGADILNNSWGGYGMSQTLTDAFHYAYNKKCVAIAAAGNDSNDVIYFLPANIDTVIAVSASDQDDNRCRFSNYGEKVDVAAPGGGVVDTMDSVYNILSTASDSSKLGATVLRVASGYVRLAGTSMACPHASGVAALILSRNQQANAEDIRRILIVSSDAGNVAGACPFFGYGRVNANRAVKAAFTSITISSPAYNPSAPVFIRGDAEIKGNADLADEFKKYELYYAPLDKPQDTITIEVSDTPVRDGILGLWHTDECLDGKYVLTLKVTDKNGRAFTVIRDVVIDNYNQPPIFVNLSNAGFIVGRESSFKVIAEDPDDPAYPQDAPWGKFQCFATGLPNGASFDRTKRLLSWRPTDADKGSYTVSLTLMDEGGCAATRKCLVCSVCLEERRLTSPAVPGAFMAPDIYENKVVYQYNMKGAIYSYDLVTNKETMLTNDYSCRNPSIYGDKVVYERVVTETYEEKNSDIYMYDLSAKREISIINDSGNQISPDIFGDKIVWCDNKGLTPGDIYMHDLSTGREVRITSGPRGEYYPSIHGDKIAYLEGYLDGSKSFHVDLSVHDLSANQELKIADEVPAWSSRPAIFGDKIVYEYFKSIHVYDLSKKKDICIADGIRYLVYPDVPDIYNDKVVWEEYVGPGKYDMDVEIAFFDIYLYDLFRNIKINLTPGNAAQHSPKIYKDKIVYEDTRIGGNHVFLTTVAFPPQIISIAPQIVYIGSTITITGKDFGSNPQKASVEFTGGVSGAIDSWDVEKIVCRVPQKAKTGPVTVTTLGGRSNGAAVTVIPPPTAPANLTADAVSLTEARLVWENTADSEDGFIIQCSEKSTFKSNPVMMAILKKPGLTSLVFSGLKEGKKYYFRIKAYNASGDSPYSNTASGTMPVKPSITSISPTCGKVGASVKIKGKGFSWQNNRQVLFTGTGGIAGANISLQGDTGMAVTVPKLPKGAYTVKVKNSLGESNSKSFTVK